jgi:outer membrane protein assembly factor BamA
MHRLVFLCCLAIPARCLAQLPARVENCLPYPTFAQEIRQMQEEQRAKTPPPRRLEIKRLVLNSRRPLPKATADRIADEVKSKMNGDDDREDPDWADELAERVRDGWQHHGYYKIEVGEPVVQVLHETANTKTVVVSLHVYPGKLYRTGDIQFSRSTIAGSEQMRSLFPIHQGDIFDTHKLGEGVNGLRYLYGEQGFINFAAVPSFEIDDSHNLVSVNFDLEEGKPFRVGKFTILGLEQSLVQKLVAESGLRPGSIFNPRLLEQFFTNNKSVLPPDANFDNDVEYRTNEQEGTVDIIMDFRTCP